MELSPQFSNYIARNGNYTKTTGAHHQRRGPEKLTGTVIADGYAKTASGADVFSAVKDLHTSSSLRTNAPNVKGPGGEFLSKIISGIEENKDPAHQAARQILSHVQGAMGGIPAAFGSVDNDLDDKGRFSVRIEKASPDGTYASGNAHPDASPATLYVDPTTHSLYLHNEPTDPRWK